VDASLQSDNDDVRPPASRLWPPSALLEDWREQRSLVESLVPAPSGEVWEFMTQDDETHHEQPQAENEQAYWVDH